MNIVKKVLLVELRARLEQTRCRVAVNFIFIECLGASFSRAHRHSEKWREERGDRLLLNFSFFLFKQKEQKIFSKPNSIPELYDAAIPQQNAE